jgi:DNA-binding transcriptional regulator YiaG
MSGETIAKVLELSGLSTRQFAAKIGANPKTVRRWVTGVQEPSFVSQKLVRYYFRDLVKRVENGND